MLIRVSVCFPFGSPILWRENWTFIAIRFVQIFLRNLRLTLSVSSEPQKTHAQDECVIITSL